MRWFTSAGRSAYSITSKRFRAFRRVYKYPLRSRRLQVRIPSGILCFRDTTLAASSPHWPGCRHAGRRAFLRLDPNRGIFEMQSNFSGMSRRDAFLTGESLKCSRIFLECRDGMPWALGLLAMSGPMAWGTQTHTKAGIALQLYTVRDLAKRDLEGTLKKAADMGWRYVQWSGMPVLPADKIRAALDKAGLTCIACHTSHRVVRKRLRRPGGVLEDRRKQGRGARRHDEGLHGESASMASRREAARRTWREVACCRYAAVVPQSYRGVRQVPR